MAFSPLIALQLRQAEARAAGLYLVLASLWIFASDALLTLFVGDPTLVAKMGTAKGIAFVVVTTVLLYLLLVAWGVRAEKDSPAGASAPAVSGQRGLIGIFLGLAVLVPLIGFGIVRLQAPRVEQAALNDLRAIGDLKAGQIESWLHEWRADADMLVSSVGFIENLDQWRRTGDAQAKRHFLGVLQSLEQVHQYEVELLDKNGRRLLVEDQRPDTASMLRQTLLPAALRSGRIQASELFRDSAGRIHFDLIVPLILQEPAGPRPVGVAVMRAPVEHFLFPLIQTWPTPSPSGETVLVRQEGNNVLFLNELRHRSGTALSFRLPIASHPGLPAAIGMLEEKSMARDGIDYRNVPVLAAMRPIRGTSWHLVTKLDREEVLAPLKDLTRWISLLALVAVATVAVVVTMLWRQQQRGNRLELVAQAAEKDKLLKLFYDLPFMGMATISPGSQRFVVVNDGLCDMLGYPRQELLNRTWTDILHADDCGALVAGFELLLAGEVDSLQSEARFRRQDGRDGVAEINVRGARRSDGSVEMLVAVIQDVTARKEAEQGLQRLNAELERRVEERTAELVVVNQELQAFTYAASHDLKAPLRAIKSFSGLLERRYRDRLEGDGLEFLDFIQGSVTRMNALIDDLLAYARIDQGSRDTQPVDLPEMVRTILTEQQEDIRQRGAEVRLELPAATVLANPSGLAQVLRNLLENAFKFSANATPPIVEIRGEVNAGEYLLLIRDNGIGFDMAHHDRIFAIFQRLHTHENYAGSGVGLALVKKAMERMGGQIWAESVPGQGATFFLQLQMA